MKYKLYFEIQKEFYPNKVPYSSMLLSNEWHEKRVEINNREGGVCHSCHQEIHDKEVIKVYKNNKNLN